MCLSVIFPPPQIKLLYLESCFFWTDGVHPHMLYDNTPKQLLSSTFLFFKHDPLFALTCVFLSAGSPLLSAIEINPFILQCSGVSLTSLL